MRRRTPALRSSGLYPQPHRPAKGVRNLAMGILVQAVRDICPRKCPSEQRDQWRGDALGWFSADGVEPGSFLRVARVLEVAPLTVRAWLASFLKSDRHRQREMASRLIHFRLTR